eukprot:TRINITY_DN14211_c0_g1_i6.p1 TRINITY_DN14211_c0_g1~~TRINITY_DN14211_c0_g1_i6.p1  ORF type:complete len:1181 (+),score=297.10 TRINITY_DN14211_c0_g1_i6:94-3543(+)
MADRSTYSPLGTGEEQSRTLVLAPQQGEPQFTEHHGAGVSFGIVGLLLLLPVTVSVVEFSSIPQKECYSHPYEHLVVRRLDASSSTTFSFLGSRNRTVAAGFEEESFESRVLRSQQEEFTSAFIEEAEDAASPAKDLAEGQMKATGCHLRDRATITLWIALVLLFLLKVKSVESFKVLIGSTESAQRPGCAGVMMRLVALWSFWGPVMMTLLTVYGFHHQFSNHHLEIVMARRDEGYSYYAVDIKRIGQFQADPSSLHGNCTARLSMKDWREFDRTAFGFGSSLMFAMGAVFMGLGELFKIDLAAGYMLQGIVSFGFLSLFTASILQDPLMSYYDHVTDAMKEYGGEVGANLEEAGNMLDNLSNLSLEAVGGPLMRFEGFAKAQALKGFRPILEPLAEEKGLSWSEVETVAHRMGIAGLTELGPEAWFQQALQNAAPLLKASALHNFGKHHGHHVEKHGVTWDDVKPHVEKLVDHKKLTELIAKPEDIMEFVTGFVHHAPIAIKICVKKHESQLQGVASELKMSFEDLQACFSHVPHDAIPNVIKNIDSILHGDAAKALDALFLQLGPAAKLWKLARMRRSVERVVENNQMEWFAAVEVLKTLELGELDRFEKEPENFLSQHAPESIAVQLELLKAKNMIEPALKDTDMDWPGFFDLLSSTGAVVDVQAARANPQEWIRNIERWKEKKKEDAQQKEEGDTDKMVNMKERLKVVWPAMLQNAASAMWLMIKFVDADPCVRMDPDSSPELVMGLVKIHDEADFVNIIMICNVVMIALIFGTLLVMFIGSRRDWRAVESRGPLVILVVFCIYLLTVSQNPNPFKSSKTSSTGVLQALWHQVQQWFGHDGGRRLAAATALGTVASKFPLNAAMAASYAGEAGTRTVVTQISTPAPEEQKSFKDFRAEQILAKQAQLVKATPPELKDKAEALSKQMKEANEERLRQEREAELARQRGEDRKEALRKLQEEKERLLREMRERVKREAEERERLRIERERQAEEERLRKEAEETERQRKTDEDRRKREEEEAALEAKRKQIAEQLEKMGQININLPFVEGTAKLDQVDKWTQEFDDIAGAMKIIEEHHPEKKMRLEVSVSTRSNKEKDEKILGLLKRRLESVKAKAEASGLTADKLKSGKPVFKDSEPRVIIKTIK